VLVAADDAVRLTEDWLAAFGPALAEGDERRLRALFHDDSHWRDVLALTWRIDTVNGGDAIAVGLTQHARRARLSGLRLAPGRAAPRTVTRAGREVIEAIVAFETADGRGDGVLRLTADADGAMKAWTLLTTLEELRLDRARGKAHARDFRGPNWLDLRRESVAYAGRDPTVLVVGGGQAGLSIAARLTDLGVDTLIVDRAARVGDNWRKRYHALTLHNQTHVNHLPFMPFPPNWPTYIPKDKLAGWFEAYVEALELNYWTGTDVEGGEYDGESGHWRVTVRRADGERRVLQPRHVVLATGVSGIPNIPHIPTLDDFRGTVLHSGQYQDGDDWAGKRALVIGTGNSGHDIAQDLYSGGAQVTLVQRCPTLIVNLEPSAQLPYALYSEGLSLEDCDLVATSMPVALAKESHRRFTRQAAEMDKPLLDGLQRVGFKLDFGEDGTGWQFKYLTRGGGYYFNVGCSDLVADGSIGLAQFADIECFVPEGARLRTGRMLPADLVVLATGWKGQEHLVAKLFGEDVADRVGPIWGFGDGEELRNMYVRTKQPGLYFIAGSLAQCRIYSKYLALQIKADETGLL
jgi:cation diffusion facilitator CzcD-associated flavoprotein CzcO